MNKENTSSVIFKTALDGLEVWEKGIKLDSFLEDNPDAARYRKSLSSLLYTYFRNKALIEFAVAKFREGNDGLDAFGFAEAFLRKRQVAADGEHYGVAERIGGFVESAGTRRTYAGIEAGYDIENFYFAREVREGDVRERVAGELEAGGG